MKIRINYELIDKIKESKTGISLIRNNRKSFIVIGTALALTSHTILSSSDPKATFLISLAICTAYRGLFMTIENSMLKEIYSCRAISQLKHLAELLRGHYINTDYELLQAAYAYETQYSFVLDDAKIPRIKQSKFIMVPVVDRDGEKEVSLVQEHLIGSLNYDISYGSPNKSKVLKYVYNSR